MTKKTKNEYQILVHIYEKRMAKTKMEIKTLQARNKSLRTKVKWWNKKLHQIEVRDKWIRDVRIAAEHFFSIKLDGKDKPKERAAPRWCYFKYLYDNNTHASLSQTVISREISVNQRTVSNGRKFLNRSFQKSPELLRKYKDFMIYAKSLGL